MGVSPARQSLTAAPSLRKKCRSQAFRKKNKDSCKDALDKCKNRMFRAANPRKCEADKTDRAWLAKRCKNKKFLANEKNAKVCQLGNIAVTETDSAAEKFDSLEDLVKKCNTPSFKSKNADKCKVVESVDIFAVQENESKTKGSEVSEMTLSSDKEEPLTGDLIKEEIMETIPIEAFSEEEEPKNEINEDEEANSVKGKKKKRKDKISKSDCNKPKYSAKHPEECGSVESKQLNAVLVKKCKKEKYRKKHGKRCQDLKSFADNTVDVDGKAKGRCSKAKYRANHPEACANVEKFVLKDVRCKKAVFRKNYPDLCPGVVEEEDPDWLEDRCKHKNFRLKNADICRDLCPQKKWSKLYRDICDGLPAVVQHEITDEQNSIIDSVIEDIKDIVSKETTKQSTSAPTSTTSTTTTATTTTTTVTTTHTTTTTSTTTTTTTTTTSS